MAMDKMTVEILDDGQVKIQTSDISQKNHMSADELLDMVEDMVGGQRQTTPVDHEFWRGRTVKLHGKVVKNVS